MSFEKRNYISGQTVITAKNLNDIQDELIRQAKENHTPIATSTVPGKVAPSAEDFTISETGALALGVHIKPVSALPETTDPNTLYLIPEEAEP